MESDDKRIRLLFLEDSPNDVELVRQKLADELPFKVDLDSAGDEDEYVRHLVANQYDVILADYTLPGYNAMEALRVRQRACPEVPFICVSGTIGEDFAVEILKQGATDYVLKDRLNRLTFAIIRALEGTQAAGSRKELSNAQKLAYDIADAAPSMTVILDKQISCTWADRQFMEFVGRPLEDVLGDGWQKLVHPGDLDRWLADPMPVAGQGIIKAECRLLRHDGQLRWALVLVNPRYDIDGEFSGYIASLVDITYQKDAEQEIIKINHSLNEAQRIAHIGSWEWNMQNGTVHWSDEMFRLLGYEPGEVCERKGLYFERMVQEDAGAVRAALDRSALTAEPFEASFRIIRPDGQVRHIHSRACTQVDMTGRPVRMAGTMHDVTELKLQESAIQEANENNRLILDSISDGVAMYDYNGVVLNINRQFAARFGKSASEIIGTNLMDYLPEEVYGELGRKRLQKIRNVFETGSIEVLEDTRDGRYFRNRFYPVIKGSRVHAVTLFSADITVQKRAEEEARRRADTEMRLSVMTEFFTNVSHELKTPLSLILMQLDMMRIHTANPERMLSLMSDATLNCYRLTRLVSNLLDITKMDSGFLKLNPRNRDMVAIVRSIGDSVVSYAAARGISLSFTCGMANKQMDVDSEKMERILLNLLSNAIKHTPSGGSIAIRMEDRGETVLISVKDTGEGIPADRLETIFSRFVQVNDGYSRPAEGCGIGLALAKSMVELHGGSIWVESEVGHGSTFFVELPVRNESGGKPSMIIEGSDLEKKVKMELSDLYIKVDA